MPARSRTILLGLALALADLAGAADLPAPASNPDTKPEGGPAVGPKRRPAPRAPRRGTKGKGGASVARPLAARWMGQDGQDWGGGPSAEERGNDVQDIRIALSGLPARREVVHAVIKGHGADAWEFNGPYTPWTATLRRPPGSTAADLFLEPTRVETGRSFTLQLRYDDGTTAELHFQGRTADPNLRMPGAALQVRWGGQDRQDWTGPGIAVGPDGLQDVRLDLTKLSPKAEVRSITLDGPAGAAWQFGLNPKGHANAEFDRRKDDPSRGDFYFQPTADIAGKTLRMTVEYANGKIDRASVLGGRSNPELAMPSRPLPKFVTQAISGRWLGQGGGGGRDSKRGDVHVSLAGLPAERTVVAASLSDSAWGHWAYQAEGRPKSEALAAALPLDFRRAKDRTRADLFFAPDRDESKATMVLCLTFKDGSMAIVDFPGGPCDPGLKVAGIAPMSAVAKPGDDLQALANRSGTVRLAKGTYRLARPLVLDHSITLTGEPGTTLMFSQTKTEPPWTAAIKIHRSHTTLQGFKIRFAGPIRWKEDVSYGPAVVGATDNLDRNPQDPKVGLLLTGLDIEAPPAADPGRWSEDPRLIRMANATSGRIVGNVLKGGTIEVLSGPWEIANNDYRGTVLGMFSHSFIATHYTHDVTVRGNRAEPVGPSGKTWRFLVMTGSGVGDRIEDNTSEAIGIRDDDTIPPTNEPEIFLTEAYSLHFEGKPESVSPDRRVVRIVRPLGEPARTGAVVSILTGPDAGQWRRVAQAIDRETYLLDAPLPVGAGVISISKGFVDEIFARNTIVARAARGAQALVLVGNHFGTIVRDNRIVGAGEAFRITAMPTERPMIWGWSHAPFLGGVIEGNTIEDSERGGLLGVEHGTGIKTNSGRVYMAVTLRNNTVRWSEGFLARLQRGGATGPPPGITIGYLPTLDLGELVVQEQGNRVEAPSKTKAKSASALRVLGAQINGKRTPESPRRPASRTSPIGRGGSSTTPAR